MGRLKRTMSARPFGFRGTRTLTDLAPNPEGLISLSIFEHLTVLGVIGMDLFDWDSVNVITIIGLRVCRQDKSEMPS
jgi:hypothetical protein